MKATMMSYFSQHSLGTHVDTQDTWVRGFAVHNITTKSLLAIIPMAVTYRGEGEANYDYLTAVYLLLN